VQCIVRYGPRATTSPEFFWTDTDGLPVSLRPNTVIFFLFFFSPTTCSLGFSHRRTRSPSFFSISDSGNRLAPKHLVRPAGNCQMPFPLYFFDEPPVLQEPTRSLQALFKDRAQENTVNEFFSYELRPASFPRVFFALFSEFAIKAFPTSLLSRMSPPFRLSQELQYGPDEGTRTPVCNRVFGGFLSLRIFAPSSYQYFRSGCRIFPNRSKNPFSYDAFFFPPPPLQELRASPRAQHSLLLIRKTSPPTPLPGRLQSLHVLLGGLTFFLTVFLLPSAESPLRSF